MCSTLKASCIETPYQHPAVILAKEVHNWVVIRQIIIFAGNLFSIIYGIMIIFVIKWSSTELSPKLDPMVSHKLDNAFTIAIFIIIIASFGCVSLIIKRYSKKKIIYK